MSRRPTVLVNHLLEPPNRITGITRYLFALLSELLVRDLFDYVLATAWDPKELPTNIRNSGARLLTLPYHNSMPHNLLLQTAALPRIIRRTTAAVEFSCNPVGSLWPAWPRIVTIHDLYFDLIPNKYPFRHRLWWRLFFPATLASCARAVCVSSNTHNDLQRFYPRYAYKGFVVHEASTLASARLADIEQTELNIPYALYVGNISPNKGSETLVRGLELVEANGHLLNVYHVGQDSAGLLSRALANATLRRPVRSIGQLSDAALASAYANATCLIVPSTHEGFCLPVVESQSFGTPVVCSDIPVLHEVAGDGALFFHSNDAAGLASCLITIFDNTDTRRMVGLAAKKNASRFSWAKAAAEIEAIFVTVATK